MDCSSANSGSLSLPQKYILNGSEDINESDGALSVKLKINSKSLPLEVSSNLRIYVSLKSTPSNMCGSFGHTLGSQPPLSTHPPYKASPAIAARFPSNTSWTFA